MFKKTFLAVAVGAALGSTGANAVDFAFDVNDWTDEGAERVVNFAVPDVTVTLGKEYTPDDLIYAGDEMRDIRAARKAGVTGIGVCWGFNTEKALHKAGADYTVDNISALHELLEKL